MPRVTLSSEKEMIRMRRVSSRSLVQAWCALMAFSSLVRAGQAGQGDVNFEVTTLAEGFSEPTALQQAPDGRVFVIERGGTVSVFDPAASQTTRWARIDVVTNGECGLLGLALHPEFPSQPYIYFFASVSIVEQQIIRLKDQAGVGVEATVIRGGIPTQGSNHNGGCVRVGPDGMIYFSVGDNGTPDSSQSLATLAGKICRIRLDGSVPDDNPFLTPTGTPRSIYALGFRNPFRFCFAADGRLFVMDVGSSDSGRREEINLVGYGTNCGWPVHEGAHPDAAAGGYTDPIYEYHDKGSSIAGCAVYDGRQFPSAYRGNLFHLDYTSHGLFRAVLDGNRVVSHELLVQGEGGPVDLTVLHDGTLAWCELFTGKVKRVRYIGPPDPADDGAPPQGDEGTDVGAEVQTATPRGGRCGEGFLAAVAPLALMCLVVRHRA